MFINITILGIFSYVNTFFPEIGLQCELKYLWVMIAAVNICWTVTENVNISLMYSFLISDEISICRMVLCICLVCLYWKYKGLYVTCCTGRGVVQIYLCLFLTLGLDG